MDLPLTGDSVLAVAATGGAAGAQIEPDPDFPDDMDSVTYRFGDVIRLASSILPWHLSFKDAALLGALVIIILAQSLLNVVPSDTWANQGWMLCKLLVVLMVIYGVFGITCSLWVKLFRKTRRTASEGSFQSAVSLAESKNELVRRWIDNLPEGEHQHGEKSGHVDNSPYIDPVGDGQSLASEIEVKEFSLAASGSHRLSATPTKIEHASVVKGEMKTSGPAQGGQQLPVSDCSSPVVNVLPKPFGTDNFIFESGCPGGDVAWSILQVKSSHHETTYKSATDEAVRQPIDTQCAHHIRAASYDYIEENAYPDPDIEEDSFQDGLNFSPDESPDESESMSPEEEVDNAEHYGEESNEVVRVFSKGLLSRYESKTSKEEDILHTTEPKLESAAQEQAEISWQIEKEFILVNSEQTLISSSSGPELPVNSLGEFVDFANGKDPGCTSPTQTSSASSAISVVSRSDFVGRLGVEITGGFEEYPYGKAPGLLPPSQIAEICSVRSRLDIGSRTDVVAEGFSDFPCGQASVMRTPSTLSVGSWSNPTVGMHVDVTGLSDFSYGNTDGIGLPSHSTGISSSLRVESRASLTGRIGVDVAEGFSDISYAKEARMGPPSQLTRGSSTVIVGSRSNLVSDMGVAVAGGFSDFPYGKAPGTPPPRQLTSATRVISRPNLKGGTTTDVAERFTDFPYGKAPGTPPQNQLTELSISTGHIGFRPDLRGSMSDVPEGFVDFPYSNAPGMGPPSQLTGGSSAPSVGSRSDLASDMGVPVAEGFSDLPFENVPVTVMRPPSQPAGASSALSVTQAFLIERNALSDEEYNALENQVFGKCPCSYQQSEDYGTAAQPVCINTLHQHEYCCHTYSNDPQLDIKQTYECDHCTVERTTPYFSCGARPMCESEQPNKFYLSSIPEDAPLTQHYQ